MRRVIAAAVLLAMVSVAGVAVWRLQRRDAIERALGRDLQSGMPLAEVTEYLRRLGVDFTIDSAAGGPTVVSYWRKVERNGTVSEQQIVFDEQERLLDLRAVKHVVGR